MEQSIALHYYVGLQIEAILLPSAFKACSSLKVESALDSASCSHILSFINTETGWIEERIDLSVVGILAVHQSGSKLDASLFDGVKQSVLLIKVATADDQSSDSCEHVCALTFGEIVRLENLLSDSATTQVVECRGESNTSTMIRLRNVHVRSVTCKVNHVLLFHGCCV